jgi:copper chaperone CopZ
VKRALEGLSGVRQAEVSFDREEAIVSFEEGKANIEQMIQAVAELGFRAREKKSP